MLEWSPARASTQVGLQISDKDEIATVQKRYSIGSKVLSPLFLRP
jgi:hypothetical protein